MQPINPRRMSPAELEALTRRDRNRIIVLTLGAVVLGVGYLVTLFAGDRAREREAAEEPMMEARTNPEEQVIVPAFDDIDLLDAIEDSTEEQRLSISDEALDGLVFYSSMLLPRHFDQLGVTSLDAEMVSELQVNPGEHRGEAYLARGMIVDLGRRQRSDKLEESYGTLRLEDGSMVHVASKNEPEGELGTGDWAALEGFFVQNWRGSVEGSLVDAPLLAGSSLRKAYPPIEVDDLEDIRQVLITQVADDQLGKVTGEPFDEMWTLMTYASERAAEVNWEEAIELNTQSLSSLADDGAAFRAVPCTIPISRNMGSYTVRAKENPLRLERVTRGWIGNFAWTGSVPVIQWIGPFDKPDLADWKGGAKLLTARGFFLKNVYYEQKNGDPGRAPLFVMSDVDIFVPERDTRPAQIALGVVVLAFGMVLTIWFFLRQDKRAAADLQQQLARRRRAREARAAAGKAD